MSLAFELMGEGVPFTIKKLSRLVSQMKTIISGLGLASDHYVLDFTTKLEAWRSDAVASAEAADMPDRAQRTQDVCECIFAAIRSTGAETMSELWEEIQRLMVDDGEGVTLSSIHRAKGLEADRVILIRPDLIPSEYAKQDWQKTQEENLLYVAYTRARDTLYILEEEDA